MRTSVYSFGVEAYEVFSSIPLMKGQMLTR